MNMEYYVYQARGLNGVLLYIGQGRGHRYRHCNSGISSCLELNRYFFEHGADAIKVNILSYFLTREEALLYEKSCIKKLKPLFNKDFNIIHKSHKNLTDFEKMSLGLVVDYSRLMKQYLTALEIGDKDTIQTIANFSEEHKLHVDVLGIDKIRAIGLNKTKITQAYNLKLRFNSLTVQIKNNLSGVYIGSRYSLSQITQILHEAYKKVDYSKNVKSTDIKNYFNVQDVWMTIDGKRCKGYLILEDLYKEVQYED